MYFCLLGVTAVRSSSFGYQYSFVALQQAGEHATDCPFHPSLLPAFGRVQHRAIQNVQRRTGVVICWKVVPNCFFFAVHFGLDIFLDRHWKEGEKGGRKELTNHTRP